MMMKVAGTGVWERTTEDVAVVVGVGVPVVEGGVEMCNAALETSGECWCFCYYTPSWHKVAAFVDVVDVVDAADNDNDTASVVNAAVIDLLHCGTVSS
jgi:hypothetical protein